MTLPMQLRKKQMDPASTFEENEPQCYEKLRAMENVDSVSNKFEYFSSFFWQKMDGKFFFGKSQYSKLLNWKMFHWLVQKN